LARLGLGALLPLHGSCACACAPPPLSERAPFQNGTSWGRSGFRGSTCVHQFHDVPFGCVHAFRYLSSVCRHACAFTCVVVVPQESLSVRYTVVGLVCHLRSTSKIENKNTRDRTVRSSPKGAAGAGQRATCRLQYTKIGLRASTNRITQNHPESRTCHERKLRLGLGLGPCALGLALGDDANRESSPVEHVNLNLICLKSVVIETRGSCRVSALAQNRKLFANAIFGVRCDTRRHETHQTT
jgi:hypothetical protein